MKFLNLITVIVGVLGATFAVVTAPDSFEFGGYLQQGLTHLTISVCTLAVYIGGSNLIRN